MPALLRIFLCCLLVSPAKSEQINYLVIGSETEPLQYSSEKEAIPKGIITEIIFEIFEQSEHEVTLHLMPWRRQLLAIENGSISNWLIYALPDWLGGVSSANFSEGLFEWRHAVITQKGTEFSLSNSLLAIDKTLLLVKFFDYPGLDSWDLLNKFSQTRHVFSNRAAIDILSKTNDHVFIGEIGRSHYSIHELDLNADKFDFQGFSHIISTQLMRLAYDSNLADHIGTFINSKIKAMKESGRITKILRHYHWTTH